MRPGLVIVSFLIAISARAQEQERKLVDRLLKPDTTLASAEQNKKFTASTVAPGHSYNTPSFYVQDNRLAKNFAAADRHLATTTFTTDKFATKSATQPKSPALKSYPTGSAGGISTASTANKSYAVGDFAGNRSFSGKGKSQKSLDAQHHALTIDEVRELLNKNK